MRDYIRKYLPHTRTTPPTIPIFVDNHVPPTRIVYYRAVKIKTITEILHGTNTSYRYFGMILASDKTRVTVRR